MNKQKYNFSTNNLFASPYSLIVGKIHPVPGDNCLTKSVFHKNFWAYLKNTFL